MDAKVLPNFCQFQPGVAYVSAADEKSTYLNFNIISQAISTFFLVIRNFILFVCVNFQVMSEKHYFSNFNSIIIAFKAQMSLVFTLDLVSVKILIFSEV